MSKCLGRWFFICCIVYTIHCYHVSGSAAPQNLTAAAAINGYLEKGILACCECRGQFDHDLKVVEYLPLQFTVYVNGTFRASGSTPTSPTTGLYNVFGWAVGADYHFLGSTANIQVYNTSLSPSEISALYSEGIGGAPIRIQNLTGWWPLNGNANDYSGNNNNGQINGGVSFNSTWNSQYTPP